ncbi:putative HTH-type transcriptional regulator [compost metagenome]
MIIKLAELYEVSPSWLQGYSANDSESIVTANYLTANALHIVTRTGDNLPVMQTSSDLAFHVDYLQKRNLNRNRILSIYQLDTSMEPLINKGDSMLIDQTAVKVKGRDLFALVVGQDIWVRWITQQLDNSYVLTAEDAKSYPEQVLSAEQFQKLDIVGRICHIGHSR